MRRRKRNIIIGILTTVLVCMGTGYAILSQNLSVVGKTSITGSWNVYIDSITYTVGGNATSAEETISSDKLSATLEAELLTPADYVEYTIKVKNTGNIDAKLYAVTPTITNSHEYVSFTNSLSSLTLPYPLLIGGEMTFKVKVVFNDTTDIDSSTTIRPVYKLDLSFEQIKNGEVVIIPEKEPILATSSGYPVEALETVGRDVVDYEIRGNWYLKTAAGAITTPSIATAPTIGGVGDLVTDSSDPNYGKYKITILQAKKNLFEPKYAMSHLKNIGSSSNIYIVDMFLKPNTDYTISTNCYSGSSASIFMTNINTSASSANNGVISSVSSRTVRTDSEGRLWVWIRRSGGIIRPTLEEFLNGTYWVQLEEGNVATAFDSYPIDYNIYLDEPLYKPDYIYFDTGELSKKSVVKTFTGAETNWVIPSGNSNVYRSVGALNDPSPYLYSTETNAISNGYPIMLGASYGNVASGTIGFQANGNIFIGATADYSTVNLWKAHLQEIYAAGNPLQVVYMRSDAVVTTLTGLPIIDTYDESNTTFLIGNHYRPYNMVFKYYKEDTSE